MRSDVVSESQGNVRLHTVGLVRALVTASVPAKAEALVVESEGTALARMLASPSARGPEVLAHASGAASVQTLELWLGTLLELALGLRSAVTSVRDL